MYFHRQELQHKATPDKPDAVYARKLQEVLGGQYGEISVAMQYPFQAWNMHMPGKYRDLVFGIGAEEMGHVEMLAIMIAQLLEKSPLGITEEVFTLPAHRGRGIGAQLLHAVEEACQERAITTLRLDTRAALAEACAMYERNGFGRVDAFNDEPYSDRWYSKTLAESIR